MAKSKKKMCKWDKDSLDKKFDKFKDMVKKPTHACGKCARVANDKKAVCKPVDL